VKEERQTFLKSEPPIAQCSTAYFLSSMAKFVFPRGGRDHFATITPNELSAVDRFNNPNIGR
jgi:hypothetical protein